MRSRFSNSGERQWQIKKRVRDERCCCPVVAVNSHVSRCRAARQASVAPAPSAGSSRRTYSTRASAAAASSRRRSTARRLWNATGWVLLDGLSIFLFFSLFLLCVSFLLARTFSLFFSFFLLLHLYLSFVPYLSSSQSYACVLGSSRAGILFFLARSRIFWYDPDQAEGRKSCSYYVRWACIRWTRLVRGTNGFQQTPYQRLFSVFVAFI